MEYVQLGKSDLKVSKVCLGCMGFGDANQGMHHWTLDYPATKEIIQHAIDSGINFFDTAMAYQNGTSEEYLGRALEELGKRKDVVIATKFTNRTAEQIASGLSIQQHIHNCVEASLKRLRTDFIDLYIYHIYDLHTPIEDVMEGLHEVIQEGKVKYIGVSNCFAWQLEKANMIARSKGYEEFVSIQGHYNLIFREEEREMVPLCKEENIALTPYSALAAGRLSKRPGEGSQRLEEDTFAKGKYGSTAEQDQQIIERVMEIADRRQVTMTEVALSWLYAKSTSPVVGATKPHHIDGAVKAVDLHLTAEEMTYLEELYQPHALVGAMLRK